MTAGLDPMHALAADSALEFAILPRREAAALSNALVSIRAAEREQGRN